MKKCLQEQVEPCRQLKQQHVLDFSRPVKNSFSDPEDPEDRAGWISSSPKPSGAPRAADSMGLRVPHPPVHLTRRTTLSPSGRGFLLLTPSGRFRETTWTPGATDSRSQPFRRHRRRHHQRPRGRLPEGRQQAGSWEEISMHGLTPVHADQ